MKTTFQWLILGLVLLSGLAQAAEPVQFYLGVTPEVTLKALGKPTFAYPPDAEGKVLWYYNKAVITFLNGKVVSWRYFNEQPPALEQVRLVGLGSTQQEVATQLGFPPNALRYTGLVIGKKPVGEEEWTYAGGTLVFQDGLVVGWRNVTNPVISLGRKVPGAKPVIVGSPARALLASMGTPPALTCYVKSGDQIWAYPGEQFLLREGKVVWSGLPKPRTAAERPPVREDGPAAAGPNEDGAPQQEDQGFLNDKEFVLFRQVYQQTIDKIVERNPRFADTSAYRAMMDCMQKQPWWSIRAQADINEDYARGLEMIETAYNEYLDQLSKNQR